MNRTRQYFPCIHRIINFPTCLLASLLFPVTHVWVITGRNDRIQVRKYLVSLGFISPVGHWRQLFNSTTFRSVQGSYVNSLLSHILLGNRRSRLSKPHRAQTSFNVINSWKKRGLSLASGPLYVLMIPLFGTDRDPLTRERLKYALFSDKKFAPFWTAQNPCWKYYSHYTS